jgi:c-di-GMP-binding flagellar brake protein YcgR
MMPVLQPERRRYVRVPFDQPVQAEPIPQSSPNHLCHLLCADLSEGGVRLSSPQFFPLESLVLLDLESPPPAAAIRAVGRVAWAEQVAYEDRWRVGVEFAELSDEARALLRKLMSKGQVVPFSRR